jgi:hypothetical protein
MRYSDVWMLCVQWLSAASVFRRAAMQQNSTESDTLNVSAVQATVIAGLAGGRTVTSAARAVGVARSTVYDWLAHDADFVAELNRARWEHREQLRTDLQMLASRAMATLLVAMGEEGPIRRFQVRAAAAALSLTRDAATAALGPMDADKVRAEWARGSARADGADVPAGSGDHE